MLKFTLDTSVFIQEGDADVVRARTTCEALHEAGVIEVAVSTRLTADKANDRDVDRRQRHVRRLEAYAPQPPAAFRVGISGLGVDVLCGEEKNGEIIGELERLFTASITSQRRRTHSIFDADHVWAHWTAKRDYFMTHDSQALGRIRRELWERFGIRVVSPAEFLAAHAGAQLRGDLKFALPSEMLRVHGEAVRP